jgi:hypothetical protein
VDKDMTIAEESSADFVRQTVGAWKLRKNQRYLVLKSIVDRKNSWLGEDELHSMLPQINDVHVVIYDMLLRNPSDTPRGNGYYDRHRIYPKGAIAHPIIERSAIGKIRIIPRYFETVSKHI